MLEHLQYSMINRIVKGDLKLIISDRLSEKNIITVINKTTSLGT